jgi:hypothetical protein
MMSSTPRNENIIIKNLIRRVLAEYRQLQVMINHQIHVVSSLSDRKKAFALL